MRINETMIYLGKKYPLIYEDKDDFKDLPYEKCTQVYGVCFYKDKVVLGFSRTMKKWSLLGGTIEPGEKIEDTLLREVKEESNMEVLKYWPIGYQKLTDDSNYQLRYACVVVPYGPFVSDPDASDDHGVDRITLINPKDFKKFIDWGKIGDRLIKRAIKLVELGKI